MEYIHCFRIGLKKKNYITHVPINSEMDNGHAKKAFFKNLQNNCLIWPFGPKKLWDISNWTPSTHFVIVWSLALDLSIINHYWKGVGGGGREDFFLGIWHLFLISNLKILSIWFSQVSRCHLKDCYSRILKQGLLFAICDFSIFKIWSEVVNLWVGHPVCVY